MSEENRIPNGPSMPPEFTLGKRYGSEDMYRDYPDLRPGSRVSVEKDGVVYTDTVQSVSYSSPEPEIVRRLSRWERIVRALTPRRFRKSLVVRPFKPASVSVSTDDPGGDPLGYTAARLAEMQRSFERLTGGKPDAD